MSKILIVAIVMCTCLGIASEGVGWDGQRKGFIVGFGAGPGLTSSTMEDERNALGPSARDNTWGLQTDFVIGYAPTSRLQVYYSNKVSWFKISVVDVTAISGLTGVGASYFLNSQVPSPFLSGGLGVAVWDDPFDEWFDRSLGFGLWGGVGYEFARHCSAELDLVWGNPTHDYPTIGEGGALTGTQEWRISSISIMLMVKVLGY